MLTPSSTSVNEGATLTYTIANGDANTEYTYAITGVDAADVTGGSLTGTVTTNSSGAATFDVSLVSDLATEGSETMTVAIGSTSTAVTVADTSVAPAGDSFTLTASRDIFTSLTANNDTVTGVYGTLNATDIVLDSSTTDADTLTGVIDGSGTGIAMTIANVETVNLDLRNGGVVDATNFSGVKTLSLDSNYAQAAFTANQLTSGVTVAVDKTNTTLNLDMYLAAGATESNTDAVTVSLAGDVTTTLDKDNANSDVDALTIHSTGTLKNTVTLVAADDYVDTATTSPDSITLTGDQDVVIKVDQTTNATGLDGATVTSSMTGTATSTIEVITAIVSAEVDFDSVSASKIKLSAATAGDAADLKHKTGSVIETGAAVMATNDLIVTNATAGGTVTFNFGVAEGASSETLKFVSSGTINLGNAATTALTIGDDITTAFSGVGNSTDINIAVGQGLTLSSLAAAAGSTLDTVTVTGTGDKDFTLTKAAATAMNTLSVDIEGDVDLDQVTAATAVSITADRSIALEEVLGTATGTTTLTINAGTSVALDDNLGANGGIVLGNTSVTAGTSIAAGATGTIDTSGTLTLSAGTTIVTAGAINATGATTITAGTTATITAALTATGNTSITATSMTLTGAIAATGKTLTLTGSSTTTSSTVDTSLAATTIILDGNGHTFDATTNDETITGALTIQGGANLAFNGGTEVVTGAVTHTGSGTVAIASLAGTYSGSSATGAVTIGTTTSGASIVTGSGDDSITLGNVETAVSTGSGNDTINAAGVTTGTNQVQINGGAGNDIITGGAATDDILTGGTGTDTFKYTAASHGSASEKIDFEVGTAGDIIHITDDAFDGAGDTIAATTGAAVIKVDTTDASTTSLATFTGTLLFTAAGYADTTALLAAIDGTSGIVETAGTDLDNEDVMVIWYDNSGADAGVYMSFLQGDADWSANGAASVTTVAQLTGLALADIANITADQFVIA